MWSGNANDRLAKLSGGQIVALDNHQPFLEQLKRSAEKVSVNDRIKVVGGDMFNLNFENDSSVRFGLKAECAEIGFEKGLREWRSLLSKKGYLVISELSYLELVGVRGTCDFQEYALIALSARSYKEGFIATLGIYKRLYEIMVKKRAFGIPKLAELAGILTARFDSNDEAYATLTKLIEGEGYVSRKDFGIYTDLAASQLYKDGMYHLKADNKVLSRGEMIDKLEEMCANYPIISMEDCLFEDDWEGWKILTKRLGNKVQLVGDDLFVTNPKRLKKGIEMGVANAIVIKPNQVGTLTETIKTIKMAKAAGYGTVISPRSGELWDPYVVHLCVGQNLGQGKIVECPTGGSSLNELIRIEDWLTEPTIFKDGKFVKVSLFSGEEIFEFPAPLGPQPVWYHAHEEPHMMGRFIGKGLKNADFKMGGPDHIFIKQLWEFGFLDDKPINVKGVEVAPKDIYLALVPKPPTPEELRNMAMSGILRKEEGSMVIRVIGKKDGVKVEHTCTIHSPTTLELEEKWPICNCTSYVVSSVSSLLINFVCKGEIKARGVITPELLEPNIRKKLLAELAKQDPPIKVFERIEKFVA